MIYILEQDDFNRFQRIRQILLTDLDTAQSKCGVRLTGMCVCVRDECVYITHTFTHENAFTHPASEEEMQIRLQFLLIRSLISPRLALFGLGCA